MVAVKQWALLLSLCLPNQLHMGDPSRSEQSHGGKACSTRQGKASPSLLLPLSVEQLHILSVILPRTRVDPKPQASLEKGVILALLCSCCLREHEVGY